MACINGRIQVRSHNNAFGHAKYESNKSAVKVKVKFSWAAFRNQRGVKPKMGGAEFPTALVTGTFLFIIVGMATCAGGVFLKRTGRLNRDESQ